MIVRDRGAKIFIETDKGVARIESVENDEEGRAIFNFLISFKVDARAVIESGVVLAEMRIKDKRTVDHVHFFDDIVGAEPVNIIDTILTAETANKRRIGHARRDGVITKKKVDLTNIVSNSVVSNLRFFSDDQAFGSRRAVDLVRGINLRDPSTFPALQRPLVQAPGVITSGDSGVLDPDVPSDQAGRALENGYHLFLNFGLDPAGVLQPRRLTTSLLQSMEGTFQPSSRSRGNFLRNKLKHQCDVGISSGKIPKRSLADFNSNALVPILRVETKRIQTVSVIVSLSESNTLIPSLLLVKINVINSNGIIMQSKKFEIVPEEAKKEFSVPEKDADLDVSIGSNNEHILNLRAGDKGIREMIVYRRVIDSTSSPLMSSFSRVFTYNADSPAAGVGPSVAVSSFPISTKKKLPLSRHTKNRLSIFRAIQVLEDGTLLGNFAPIANSFGSFISHHCVIYTSVEQSSIQIVVDKLPDDVIAVNILRREPGTDNDLKNILNLGDTETARLLSDAVSENSFTAVDRNVTLDAVYEYKAEMILRNGLKIISSTSRFETFTPRTGLVTVSVDSLTVEKRPGVVTVSFDLSAQQIDGATDILVAAVQEAGLSQFFDDDISKIRDSIKNVAVLSVERFDADTGETVDLGVVLPGIFTDTLTGRYSRNYIYRARSFMRSALELIDEIKSSLIDSEMPYIERDDPGARLIRSAPEPIDPNSPAKFYTRSSFRRGTLSYGASLSQQTAQGRFERDPTGDFASIPVSLGEETFVTLPTVRVMRSNEIAIEWSVTQYSNNIDFFAITVDRSDGNFVVGPCHNVNNNGSYLFLDRTSRDYEGEIRYKVTPVMLDGSVASPNFSQPIVVRRRNNGS